jgi:hypothetical protein
MTTKAQLEQEIALLERRLAEAKAAKPGHDTTGAYQARLLEIEDELAEKRRAMATLKTTDKTQSTSNGPSVRGGKNEV